MDISPVLTRIDDDLNAASDRLKELLRIQSISTDPDYAPQCQQAADWLVADLQSLGAEASARPTPGHPMVVGHIGEGGPHLLFYGHYDVQPVDPLELWHADPFDPQIEDTPAGKVIRGRGASDDKGQLMTFVEACRAWIAVHGRLPCRITFFFEGEEESGSPSLIPFMTDNAAELKADIALICDTGMYDPETPTIVTMLRGLMGEELTIKGPDRDLHSGMFGGIAMNPIRVLSRVLAGLHDDTGRVTLPGFYDGVPELPAEVREQWAVLGDPSEMARDFLGAVGLSRPAGENTCTGLEMIWSRPTCDVNGIWGGYTGAGFKTVLPAEAHAKVSFRLVGQQDPHAIRESFRAYVQGQLPEDCSVRFQAHGASPAATMDTASPLFEAARQALTDEWPNPAVFAGCGGSIPIAGYFGEVLDMPAMLIGFGLDDDQIHSPNEKYALTSFHKGMRSWVRVLGSVG
ncbi:M20/M25/M40 family metallo-hydrolase [Marinovum sp.]|uniref:M20/M25/M40 family metallo-hydrolase n=1 Tax=Marinovum sp. TaxID=2024839 RepID=UPI002B277251|nr:M20/M25/M40 family metallo-hydrolase [Marinovum sp.]